MTPIQAAWAKRRRRAERPSADAQVAALITDAEKARARADRLWPEPTSLGRQRLAAATSEATHRRVV